MTPRAYWDVFGNLWEETDAAHVVLVWSPAAPIVGQPMTLRTRSAEKAFGPLIGVA